ncbi:metalloprotease [Nocardiopsis sp. TSRI0078]|uniref:neutral zinc metallopeptidase n=1 Tax=unclassified Nocardiopsis TaxID=2649073 RepID=UPI000938E72E|nr:neutral zinc metallopeptidase [Nocardiopsis sp. TSRI0078]OKI13472.1 metalloprotease [Nocardiopsis sp. TSRI0078]
MYAGFGDSPASAARRADRRASGLVTALVVVLLALALLSWTTAGDEEPRPDASADGTGAVPDSDDKPGQDPSGWTGDGGRTGLSERFGQRERPSGHAALVDNPLYGTGRLSPRPCPVAEPDVDEAESMEAFLNSVADCLDDAWRTQFARAGLPFAPPERVFWEEPGVSPCRSYPSRAGAFYCRASASIYIGTSDVVEKWNGATRSVVYASLLAHEYGHHVQGESGLLEYYHEQRELREDPLERNSWTRRSELQANCLAGAFLGSVRVSYPLDDGDLAALLTDAAATADREDSPPEDRTHGSADNSVRWTRKGWEEQTPGACNTWDVPDESLVH